MQATYKENDQPTASPKLYFIVFKRDVHSNENKDTSGHQMELEIDILRDKMNTDPELAVHELSVTAGATWATVVRNLKSTDKVRQHGQLVTHVMTSHDMDH